MAFGLLMGTGLSDCLLCKDKPPPLVPGPRELALKRDSLDCHAGAPSVVQVHRLSSPQEVPAALDSEILGLIYTD